jgi:hypothetical protein
MTCCGRNRQALAPTNRTGGSPLATRAGRDGLPASSADASTVEFEYLGDKTLVVMGQGSRLQYHFVGRGARLKVDARDRVSLSMVPGLREVMR